MPNVRIGVWTPKSYLPNTASNGIVGGFWKAIGRFVSFKTAIAFVCFPQKFHSSPPLKKGGKGSWSFPIVVQETASRMTARTSEWCFMLVRRDRGTLLANQKRRPWDALMMYCHCPMGLAKVVDSPHVWKKPSNEATPIISWRTFHNPVTQWFSSISVFKNDHVSYWISVNHKFMSTFGRVLELLCYETKSQVLDMGVSQSRELKLKLYNMKTKMGLPEKSSSANEKKTSLPYIHYCWVPS